MIDDLERFKTIDTGFGYRPTKVDHIIDSIHFVKSHNNHLIQLADIAAYVLLRAKRVTEELVRAYREQKNLCTYKNSFPKWLVWIEQNASLGQKTELKHVELLKYQPFISKEFP